MLVITFIGDHHGLITSKKPIRRINKMTQQRIEAIKTKHQSLINRYIKWDRKHSDQVNQHDELYLKYEDENKLYRAEERSMRQQENSFEKLQNLWDDLPKYEQRNVTKQYKSIFGYEPYSV